LARHVLKAHATGQAAHHDGNRCACGDQTG
jgi:hypothetical protein